MHHGPMPDDEIMEALGLTREKLGATGIFPEGKLAASDEGEIRFAVGFKAGKVVLDFGQPTAWVGMSPEQAKDLARTLMKWANPVTRPRL